MLTKDAWTMPHCYGQVKGEALSWMLDARYSLLDAGGSKRRHYAGKARQPRKATKDSKLVDVTAFLAFPAFPAFLALNAMRFALCSMLRGAHFTLAGLHGASLNSIVNWLESGCLAYLRERLEALRGFSFTTFSVPSFTWVARLQEPFFHLICGSGQDWQ